MKKNHLPLLAFLALGLISPGLSASERPEIAPSASVSPLVGPTASLPAGFIVVTPPRRAEPATTTRTEAALASTDARPLQTALQVAARSSLSDAGFSTGSSASATGHSAAPAAIDGGMPSTATGLAAMLLMLCILIGRRNRYN